MTQAMIKAVIVLLTGATRGGGRNSVQCERCRSDSESTTVRYRVKVVL